VKTGLGVVATVCILITSILLYYSGNNLSVILLTLLAFVPHIVILLGIIISSKISALLLGTGGKS